MNPDQLRKYNIHNLRFHIKRKDTEYTSHLAVVPIKNYKSLSTSIPDLLHPTELLYYNKLIVEKRKASFSMGRYAAKLAVNNFIKENDLNKIEIASGIFGNPLVRYPSHNVPYVCITHDSDFAVSIAYPDVHPMSIDLEQVHDDKIEIIKSQCSQSEIKMYQDSNMAEGVFYTLLWTIKEAISKAIRCGLTIPLKLLSIKRFQLINEYQYVSDFTNFGQYKAYSFILNKHVFSLALPKKSELIVNQEEMKKAFIVEN